MDRKKLDPSLSIALDSSKNPYREQFSVFIETESPVFAREQQVLEQMGVRNVRPGTRIFTATINGDAIGKLTDQPWVSMVRAATRMKFSRPGPRE